MTTTKSKNTGKSGSSKTVGRKVVPFSSPASQAPASGAPEPTPQEVFKAPDPAPDDSLDPKVEKELTDIVTKIGDLEGTEPDDLAKEIRRYAKRSAEWAEKVHSAGSVAVLNAWATGRLLNSVKKQLTRGNFGQWRKQKVISDTLCERTAQRYMKLALEHDDVRALLATGKTLRQAYLDCGALIEADPQDGEETPANGGDTKNKAANGGALLSYFSNLQKRLRLFAESGESLTPDERSQLKLTRAELDRFFNTILA